MPPVVPGAPLAAGSIDLWCFYYEAAAQPDLLASYEKLLTDRERRQHRAFYFERDRLLYLATRALVRTVLSQYDDVAPADWRFELGSHGRPYVSTPGSRVSFNLTNTPGFVACVVSGFERTGVDAEWIDRPGETVSIAQEYFSPAEVRALRGVHPDAQRERFFHYWTLKESYIKARGLGLAVPLHQFSFLLQEGSPIRIAFDPSLQDDASHWRFSLLESPSRHVIALGADTGGAPLSVRACSYVPLRGVVPFGE
jgi:4'-phosphopantetheinyl transferase